MGAFHASCIFITVIGKQFGAVGLNDACIEESLIGIGSVDKVLKGKQYNKGVHALKIVFEAHQQKQRKKENKEDILLDCLESTELLQLIRYAKKQVLMLGLIHVNLLVSFFLLFDQSICSKLGPMALFLISFSCLVQVIGPYSYKLQSVCWFGFCMWLNQLIMTLFIQLGNSTTATSYSSSYLPWIHKRSFLC